MRYEIVTGEDSIATIRINPEGLKFKDISPELFYFPIKAYNKLFTKDETGNHLRYRDNGAMDAINHFLSTISKEDSEIIILTLLVVHNRIRDAFSGGDISDLVKICPECAEQIKDNFAGIGLLNKFRNYVVNNISIEIDKEWGNRSIDTEEMTYKKEDVIDLYVLVFLSKLMTPIFGVITTHAKSYDLGTKVAEIHCVSFIMPLINACANKTRVKLLKYIRAVGSNNFGEDSTVTHSGFTRNTVQTILMTMFLTRNAVNLNVYQDGSKLITVLNGCVNKTVGSFRKGAKKANKIEERDPTSVVADEQNQSQMEVDSVLSVKTADIALMAKVFSKQIVFEFLRDEDLDRSVHEDIVKFNITNGLEVNPLSLYVIQTLFCSRFSGLNNIGNLRITEMAELVSAAQQLVAQYHYDELAHAMSVKPTGNIRVHQTNDDKALLHSYDKSKEFRIYVNLLNELPLNSKEMKRYFGDVMLNIVQDVATREYQYRTSPEISHILGQKVANGAIAQFTDKVVNQLYRMLHDKWGNT